MDNVEVKSLRGDDTVGDVNIRGDGLLLLEEFEFNTIIKDLPTFLAVLANLLFLPPTGLPSSFNNFLLRSSLVV